MKSSTNEPKSNLIYKIATDSIGSNLGKWGDLHIGSNYMDSHVIATNYG